MPISLELVRQFTTLACDSRTCPYSGQSDPVFSKHCLEKQNTQN